MKKLFKSDTGEIHFGDMVMKGFSSCEISDVEEVLKNLSLKKFWRCNVCNDLHISEIPPKQCPTCFTMDAYVEINEKEFREMIK